MRRLIAVLLALSMLLTVGCGSSPSKVDPGSVEPDPVPEVSSSVPNGASEASKPPKEEVPGNPGLELEPDTEYGDLDNGDKACLRVFGEPYPELEALSKQFVPGEDNNVRTTTLYTSDAKDEAVNVPTVDWTADKRQLSGRYTYSYGKIQAAKVFTEGAEAREGFQFEVVENSQYEGQKFNLKGEVLVQLQRGLYNSEDWKELVCGYIDNNLNNPDRVKSDTQQMRGMITESWGGGYIGSYDLGSGNSKKLEMSSSTNITKFTGGTQCVNIIVVMNGSVQDFEEDTEAEAALREHAERLESTIWEVFSLGNEAEAVRLAPVLYVS